MFVHPAPHSIQGASPDMIRQGATLAMDLGLPFHIHVAERRYERRRDGNSRRGGRGRQ